MKDGISNDDELKELLRQSVASNLTVAFILEQMRRDGHAEKDQKEHKEHKEERVHPLAQVLETFELIREMMEPEDEEEEDDDELDELIRDEEKDAAIENASRAVPTPFESTLRYLRPRKK